MGDGGPAAVAAAARFAMRIVTGDTGEAGRAAALPVAPAGEQADGSKANAAGIFDFRSGRGKDGIGRAMAPGTEGDGAVAGDVAAPGLPAVRSRVAVTGLAMDTRSVAGSLMTAKATRGVCSGLHDAERVFEVKRRLPPVSWRQAQTIALAIPGDAVFDKAPVAFDDRGDGLGACAKGPGDRGVEQLGGAALFHRDARANVGIAGVAGAA